MSTVLKARHQYKLKTGILIVDGRSYKPYSQFKDLKEFNDHYEMFMAEHKRAFGKKEHIAINRIRKFAAKDFGVAYATLETYQWAIKEYDNVDVSVDTIKRAIKKYAQLGGLTVQNGIRADKTQAQNVLIFTRYTERKVFTLKTQIAKNESKYTQEEIDKMIEKELQDNLPYFDNTPLTKPVEVKPQAPSIEKPKTLYARILEVLERKKAAGDINTYCAIACKSIKKMRQADSKLTKQQAEDIVFTEFINVMNSKSARNTFAVYSYRLNRIVALFDGSITQKEYTSNEVNNKIGKKTGVLPSWYIDSIENPLKRAELKAAEKQAKLTAVQRINDNDRLPSWFKENKIENIQKQDEEKARQQREKEEFERLYPTDEAKQAYFAAKREEILSRMNRG